MFKTFGPVSPALGRNMLIFAISQRKGQKRTFNVKPIFKGQAEREDYYSTKKNEIKFFYPNVGRQHKPVFF